MKPDRASVVMPNSLSWVPLHGMPELSGPHQFNLRCMQVTKALKMWPKRVSRLCRALRLKDNMTTCAPRRMYYWNWWANYCYRPSNFTHWGTKAPSPSHRRDFPDVLSLSLLPIRKVCNRSVTAWPGLVQLQKLLGSVTAGLQLGLFESFGIEIGIVFIVVLRI